MKFAAIADVHGNLLALDAVLADIARRGISRIVNLGDLLSGPLWPAETADRLRALNLPTIRGNHERQLLTLPREKMGLSDQYTINAISNDHVAWLTTLPVTFALYDDVFLCHGTPQDDLTYFLEEVTEEGVRAASLETVTARAIGCDAPLILCGHTHIARQFRLDDGRFIVNPGSVGLPAYSDDAPYPHAMEAGTPHARYAIITGLTGVEHILVDYDWEAAACQAARHHRLDWATALKTGRV